MSAEVSSSYKVRWYGPFFHGSIPREHQSGLYLLYVGVYPVYMNFSEMVSISISRHMVITQKSVVPVDLLGREVMHYVNLYRQPLAVKVGKIIDFSGEVLGVSGHEDIYAQVLSAVVYSHPISCNRYGRMGFEYPVTKVINEGKYFPLMDEIIAVTKSFPPRTPG